MHYKSYSAELRQTICDLLDSSTYSRAEVAGKYNIPYSTVCDIFNSYCQNDNTVQLPRPKGKKRKILDEEDISCIREIFSENCHQSLQEINDTFYERRKKKVSIETVRQAIDDFTYSIRRVENANPSGVTVETETLPLQGYCQWFANLNDSQRDKIIFIHESSFSILIRRMSRKEQQFRVPKKKSRVLMVRAAMSSNQMIHYKVIDRSNNTEKAMTFIHEVLDRLSEPGYTLVITSPYLSVSDLRGVEESGHSVRLLTVQSRVLNPLDGFFHQWKAFINAVNPQNEEELLGAMASVGERITAEELKMFITQMEQTCKSYLQGTLVL